MRILEVSNYSATIEFSPRDMEVIAMVLEGNSRPDQLARVLPDNHPVAFQDFLSSHVQSLAVVFQLAGGWTQIEAEVVGIDVPSFSDIQGYQKRYFREAMGMTTDENS